MKGRKCSAHCLRVQSTIMGKAWWQESKSYHTAPGVRRERGVGKVNVSAQLTFLSLGSNVMDGAAHIQGGSSSVSSTFLETLSETHTAAMCVVMF